MTSSAGTSTPRRTPARARPGRPRRGSRSDGLGLFLQRAERLVARLLVGHDQRPRACRRSSTTRRPRCPGRSSGVGSNAISSDAGRGQELLLERDDLRRSRFPTRGPARRLPSSAASAPPDSSGHVLVGASPSIIRMSTPPSAPLRRDHDVERRVLGLDVVGMMAPRAVDQTETHGGDRAVCLGKLRGEADGTRPRSSREMSYGFSMSTTRSCTTWTSSRNPSLKVGRRGGRSGGR